MTSICGPCASNDVTSAWPLVTRATDPPLGDLHRADEGLLEIEAALALQRVQRQGLIQAAPSCPSRRRLPVRPESSVVIPASTVALTFEAVPRAEVVSVWFSMCAITSARSKLASKAVDDSSDALASSTSAASVGAAALHGQLAAEVARIDVALERLDLERLPPVLDVRVVHAAVETVANGLVELENRPRLPRPMPVPSTVEGSNTIDASSRVPAPVTS